VVGVGGAKCSKICFWLRLHPGPCWGNSNALPYPLAALREPTFKEKGRGTNWKGRWQEGRNKREGWRRGKGGLKRFSCGVGSIFEITPLLSSFEYSKWSACWTTLSQIIPPLTLVVFTVFVSLFCQLTISKLYLKMVIFVFWSCKTLEFCFWCSGKFWKTVSASLYESCCMMFLSMMLFGVHCFLVLVLCFIVRQIVGLQHDVGNNICVWKVRWKVRKISENFTFQENSEFHNFWRWGGRWPFYEIFEKQGMTKYHWILIAANTFLDSVLNMKLLFTGYKYC